MGHRYVGWQCVGFLVCVCLMALSALAWAGDGGEAVNASLRMSWQEMMRTGGRLMYVLLGLSVLTLALIFYFFIVLRPSQVAPRALHRELTEKIRSGNLEDARRACEYRRCSLSAVALAALDHVSEFPKGDSGLLKDVIEGEGGRQAEDIQGQTQFLLDISVVAPMVGLLGTVIGMMRAFSSVALDIAKARPIVLASGVSQALVTTAFGLLVAIPAMAFYSYFRRRAAKMVCYLEASSADLLTALMSRESK